MISVAFLNFSLLQILKNSERARMIFVHMREYLEEKSAQKFVSVDDWKRHFDDIEVSIGEDSIPS